MIYTVVLSVKRFLEFLIRLAGPLFVILASGLITGIMVIYFKTIIPYYSSYTSPLGLWNTGLGIYVCFCIAYNYVMCIFTPPGTTERLVRAVFFHLADLILL